MARVEKRLWTVGAALAVGFAALVIRAAHIQLVQGSTFAARAEAQRTDSIVLPARRGAVYDRTGVPLATTIEVYHVGIDRDELRVPAEDIPLIARQLGIPEREIRRRLRRHYLHLEGPFTAAQVLPLRGVRGVYLSADLARNYPDPDFARTLLGRPEEPGRPATGLERELDSLLAGTPGQAVVIKDGRGRELESPGRLGQFPVPGYDVVLTLDATLQDIAEAALAEAIDRLRAFGGDVVMLDPRTGEILALASRTGGGASSTSAFTAVFEPGSTAKVFVAAALLDAGLVAPAESVFGERGVWVMRHRTIHDDHPGDMPAWMTLAEAIAVSSNIGTVKFAERLSPALQYRMLRAFGLGNATGVEFPSESPGRLPRPSGWSGTTAQSLAIGYELSVTPLQLAQAYAAIANDGVLLRPALVREVRDARGDVVYRHRPEPVRRVVTAEVAAALRDMLRGVVAEGGTGASAALQTYELAGKTGTARRVGPGGYQRDQHTAVFAALFPADEPQLVTIVKLDAPRGSYAAVTAAPLTRRMLEQALAARSEGLDRGRIAREAAVPRTSAPGGAAGDRPRQIVDWPAAAAPDSAARRRVPDVRGLPLREAVGRLHRVGLQVRPVGLGNVTGTSPGPGDSVRVGTVVTVRTSGSS